MDNRRLYLPRGRMLGGCSSINAMIYVRGNRLDYDAWAAAGCDGWGYDDVLPYFRRSEDNERGEDQFHGVGGPLTVSESRSMHPLVDAMIEAGRQAGHEHNPDFNGARQEGVGRFQLTQRDGRRLSTSDAFLHPVRSRPNLTVITHAYATAAAVRGPPRQWRRVRAAGRHAADPRGRRGDRLRRRLLLAAAADDVGDRARGPAGALGHRAPRGAAGRGEPPGPLHGATSTTRPPVRPCSTPRAAGELRAVRVGGPRAADLQHPGGGRASSARAATWKRPTSSSTSHRPCSTTAASPRPRPRAWPTGRW